MDRLGRKRSVCVVAGVLSVLAFSGTGADASSSKLYECQHPVTTGAEAVDLHHISVATACKAVLTLYKWENADGHANQLYGCHGTTPYLKLHRFDGYALSLSSKTGFVMSKGHSSFAVTGTDFPIALCVESGP